MPRWDKRCKECSTTFEYEGTYAEHESDKKENKIVCQSCGGPTETVIGDCGEIVYKCAGFYGNVPTRDAHATGNM
jgi:predicted nucleic acid-binding Zn ribbon protein